MDRIWALYKKEVRGYFNSPVAYIVLTVLLVGVGYFFFQTFFAGAQASMRFFFRVAAWSFLLFGPAVTMRLIAEEKKSGSIEPLLVLPLREWELVLGKFFAAWTLLALYLAITLVYPLSIAFLGDLDGGPLAGGYIGLFFLGGIFVALGMFASTISRNQVVSLVVAFVIALLLFILDLLLPFIPMRWQNLFAFIGVDSHFQNIGRGVIDSRDAIYSLSLIGFFLFLSTQSLQARLTDHSKRWKLNRVLYIGAAIGCLIAMQSLSYNLHGRFDLTQDKQFTLSDATRDLLRELNDQLTITAYFSKDLPPPANANTAIVRDLLEEYRTASDGQAVYTFIDPDTPSKDGKPDAALAAQAQAAGVPKIEMRAIRKDKAEAVKVYMGLSLQYGDKTESLPVVQDLANLEYELTSRIAKLLQEKPVTLGFLTGHGELSTQQGLANIAGQFGKKFALKDVEVSKGAAALGEIDTLIVVGPKKPLNEMELHAIDQFIMRGGKAAFFLDRADIDMRSMIGRPLTTGLENLVASYGVTIKPAIVLDTNAERISVARDAGGITVQSLVQFPAVIRVQDIFKDSPLTKNLTNFALLFAAPLELVKKENVEAIVIAKSSPKSWLFESNDSFLADPQALPQPDAGDYVGAQNLVVTLRGSFTSFFRNRAVPVDESGMTVESAAQTSPETRLVVVGSSMWINDAMPNRLNYLLMANLVDWLAQDERLIGVRTRGLDNRPLKEIGDTQRTLFKYGNMLLPPLGLIVYGLLRWQWRKRKKQAALDSLLAIMGKEG